MRKILFSIVALLCMATSMMADEYTVTQSTFTAVSGNLNGDANISYVAGQGTATSAPQINSNVIRIYQNGGTLTVSANNDCKIKSITLGSNMNTSITYSVDGGTTSDEVMLAKGATTSVTSINADKVLFTCKGTTTSTRLYVNYLSVTYDDGKVAKVAKPTFSVAAGAYYGAQTVELACATEGASIKYSTDGTNYSDYTEPVTVSASETLYAKAVKDEDESAVATAAYTIYPVYKSLAELVAAGAPTATAAQVQVTLTNEKIQSIALNAAGTARLGVYVKSGDQPIYLYLSGVPSTWLENGTISGTVQAKWQLFQTTTWELVLPTGAWTSDITYKDPVYPFTVTDKAGNTVTTKFTGYNGNLANTLTLKYKEDPTNLTFKVNDVVTTYDATNGMTITSTTNSQKNDKYVVTVYNGETLVADQTFTYIPVVNLSSYKALEEGTEAVLKFNSGNKVTYVGTTDVYFEDASKAIMGYSLGLSTTPTAYKTISAGSIWGIKETYSDIVEIRPTTETASYSTLTQTETDVTPTALTAAQTKLEANQLRYAIIKGAKIIKNSTKYTVECADGDIVIYDKYATKAVSGNITATSYADLTCIVGISATGILQLWPLAVDNITDKISGTSGTVTWTIDMDGNMVFAPTEGESGTLAKTGTAASARPWASYVANVKTVKFNAGVSTDADASYMFKDMKNLESVDFTNFNTSNLTTMKGMFNGCSSLKAADMSMLDLAKVTTLNLTFNGCTALESVNFGDNTLAAVTNVNSMFYSCKALKSLDFSKVPGTAVTDMASMLYDCTSLESVDLSSFSTAKVSKDANAKNVFGTSTYAALPKTLILSKNFGQYVGGSYITLPAKFYMATGKAVDGADNALFDMTDSKSQSSVQAGLYEYNAKVEDNCTYVAVDKTLASEANLQGYKTFYDATKSYVVDANTAIYFAEAQQGDNIHVKAVSADNIIPAGTPVLLNSKNKEYNIGLAETTETSSNVFTGNQFKAAESEGTVANAYVLGYLDGEGFGFYPYSLALTAGQVYVTATSNPAKLSIVFDGDAPTAVGNVNAEVNANKSGKFVENGRVVIVKNGKKFNAAGALLK